MWWVLQWQRQLSTFTRLVNLLHILAQKSVITSDISLKLKTLFIRNMKVGGKKMGKKTSQPLLWPKDPPRLPGFGFFFLTWNKKGGRKEVNCFQTDVYSPLKTCTTINTADGEMTQAGIIKGIQRARNYTTVICGVPVTGQLEELCWSKPPMLLSP